MSKFTHEKIGSSGSLRIQLFDGETDALIPITSATALSAKATHTESGTVVNFTQAVIDDEPQSIFKLFRSINTFSEAGVYDVLITYTDAVGEVQKYPKEEGGLKIKFS